MTTLVGQEKIINASKRTDTKAENASKDNQENAEDCICFNFFIE